MSTVLKNWNFSIQILFDPDLDKCVVVVFVVVFSSRVTVTSDWPTTATAIHTIQYLRYGVFCTTQCGD